MSNENQGPAPDLFSQATNIPNLITSARFFTSIILFVCLAFEWYMPALFLFIIAAGTDWFDGFLARRWNMVTQLGRIFDPFCDKILICGTFIFLAAAPLSGIHAWMAVVIVGREMLVTVIRSFIEQHGGDFSAKWSGKFKMVFQCVAAGASIVALWIGKGVGTYTLPEQSWYGAWLPERTWYGVWGEPTWVYVILVVFVWLSLISTIQSGLEYVFAAGKMLSGGMSTSDEK